MRKTKHLYHMCIALHVAESRCRELRSVPWSLITNANVLIYNDADVDRTFAPSIMAPSMACPTSKLSKH